jgi:hypothetical protein
VISTNFSLWLEFEHWIASNEFDPECDGFNMKITLDTGEMYALNVWTYKLVERIYQTMVREDENLRGAYLLPPNLFVQRLDRNLIEAVVSELIKADNLQEVWRVHN